MQWLDVLLTMVSPKVASRSNPAVSGAAASQAIKVDTTNPLAGKPLRYLIGTDEPGVGRNDELIEVGYDVSAPTARGIGIAYCNLFDERNTGKFGPYLRSSDTADKYREGQIDPRGPGWERNLREQFERRGRQGFHYVELDNPDAYDVQDVIRAVDLAANYGFQVIAKNPLLMDGDPLAYVAHPAVVGAIVEQDAGTPSQMDKLRCRARKPDLPIWFVAFGAGAGRTWAMKIAEQAEPYRHMGVTFSPGSEYGRSLDILCPR